MHRAILVFPAILLIFKVVAQPPPGYYDPAGTLTGKDLQKVLHEIIDNHTVIPYSDLISCFRKTDVKNDSVVWDMYSDNPGGVSPYLYIYGRGQECGNYNSEADCFNREHSFPKSWFGDASPMLSDLFHLYPTDGYVNNRRANYPFGETKSPTWVSGNGSEVGPGSWPGYSGIIFEPINEYKGDFARTYFYMATRYSGEDAGWPGSDMVTGAEPKSWAKEMLLSWHRNDPVSTKEINRNNEVFKFQGNRNPFIDNPEFAQKIWDQGIYSERYVMASGEIQVFPNPAKETITLRIRQEGNMEVYIFSLIGNLVFHAKKLERDGKIAVNSFAPGMYLIKIVSDGNAGFLFFVKL